MVLSHILYSFDCVADQKAQPCDLVHDEQQRRGRGKLPLPLHVRELLLHRDGLGGHERRAGQAAETLRGAGENVGRGRGEEPRQLAVERGRDDRADH